MAVLFVNSAVLLDTFSKMCYTENSKIHTEKETYMKVLMLNGSPKDNGNTALALREMKAVFEAEGIEVEYEVRVDRILNRTATGFCPMESAVLKIQTPVEALEAIRKTLNALRTPKTE
jgi:hypothetical protein